MKKNAALILIVVCAGGLAFGLLELFELRFESGDVYPEYSSLRSDPLGTMAVYESLEKLRGMAVSRDFSALNVLPDGKDTTYLHLDASRDDWRRLPEDTLREIDKFLARGGRLAITFLPDSSGGSRAFEESESDNQPAGGKAKDKNGNEKKMTPVNRRRRNPGSDNDEMFGTTFVSLADRWGVDFAVDKLEQGDNGAYEAATVSNQTDLPLPESLAWHSGVVCTDLSEAWHTIYARGDRPVVVERKLGHGTVVIATDSYFLSNEAMLKDRHADLIAWLIGPSRKVVFDEAHLGVTEKPGLAVLMRKYRLHWLGASLLLLAGLFIWKNSLSLVPPAADEPQFHVVPGRDAASGFVNLLRRSVEPRDLLATCFAEWKQSAAQSSRYAARRVAQAEAAFHAEESRPSKDRNPLKTYQEISQALVARNTGHAAPTNHTST